MKKQIYTIIGGLISSTVLYAQVTLTQANHSPVPGDVNNLKEYDTTANVRSILDIVGNGVTWNFTNTLFSNGNYFADTYVVPSSLPGTSTFTNAGATVALSDSGGFYKSSSNKLEYLGDISHSGEETNFTTNTGDLMRYPFSYGINYTDIGGGSMIAPNFPPFILNATITVNADGQGTLILPSNPNVVYNNVLKVHSYVYMLIQGTGTLSTVTGTQTIDMFDFYVSGQKFPVFEAHYQKLQIPAMGVNDFQFDGNHTGAIVLGVNTNEVAHFTVYPNPATDKIYLSGLSNQTYDIVIYNIIGDKLNQLQVSDKDITEIPVAELSKGIYLLHIKQGSGDYRVIKFIKE